MYNIIAYVKSHSIQEDISVIQYILEKLKKKKMQGCKLRGHPVTLYPETCAFSQGIFYFIHNKLRKRMNLDLLEVKHSTRE